jgi:hypothetical protein
VAKSESLSDSDSGKSPKRSAQEKRKLFKTSQK